MIKEVKNYNQLTKHYSDVILSHLIRTKHWCAPVYLIYHEHIYQISEVIFYHLDIGFKKGDFSIYIVHLSFHVCLE